MAEDTEPVVRTALIPGGIYREQPQEVVPERGALGYLRDKSIGMLQGAIDIGASPAVVARDIATPDDRPAYQAVMEASAEAKKKLSGWKTEYGQAQEEGKVPADTSVLGTIFDAAPAAVAIGASGPFAPVVGGVVGHGALGNEQWDLIRHAPDEVLKERSSKYRELRDQGMSMLDAKREIYSDRNTWASLGLNVGANMVFAGVGQKLIGNVIGGALRTDAGNMAARIMKSVGVGGVEGTAAGVALGGGSELGRQAAEMGEGLRDKYDLTRAYEASVPTGINLGIIGGVSGGVGALRAPRRPIAEKLVEKGRELADNTGYTPSADEIGSDLLLVTGAELSGRRPAQPLERRATPAETTQPGAPNALSTGITPPGRPVAGEVPPATVSPRAAVVEPPPVRALPITPTERGAAPLPTSTGEVPIRPSPVPPSPVEPRPVAVEGADVSARPVATEAIEARPAVAPTAPAPVEPVKQPMTVEELRARAVDLNQSPTVGDLQKHIAEWKAENPGVKLAEQNEILKANKEVRQVEVQRLREVRRATEAAQAAEERAAKRQAAEDAKVAKAKTKAEVAKSEPKAPTVAEEVKPPPTVAVAEDVKPPEPTIGEKIKEAVEAPKPVPVEQQLQAAREALGEHDAAVDRKHGTDTVGASLEKRSAEHVAEGDRLLQRVKDLEAQVKAAVPKAPVAGEKAAQAIAQAAKNQQERVDLAALKTQEAIKKRDQTDVATNQAYERREVKKSEREQAAIKVFGEKTTAIDELKPLHDRIEKALPSKAKEDLQTAQRHIQGIIDSYNSELRTRGLPTLGGKFPDVVKTRAGHGPHHNVMTTLNNLARTLRQTIDTNGTRAKEAALRGLELTRKVREGKVEEVEAERAKAAQAETDRRNTTTLGDRTDKIVSEPKGETYDEHMQKEYVGGKRLEPDEYQVNRLRDMVVDEMMNGDKIKTSVDGNEFIDIVGSRGGKVERSTLGEVMAPFRPKDPIMGAVFDAVQNMVKDYQTVTWSPEMHAAYYRANGWAGSSRAFQQPETATVFFKPDTKVARTVFHEALHAATSRALDGSQRLNHLVRALQDIIADRYMADIRGQDSLAYKKSIMNEGRRINTHEFISELFTRQEVRDMVQRVRLRPEETKKLIGEGYVPDKGRSILGTLWHEFLTVLGFESKTPNAMKVAVDMLQDVFEREGALRQRDVDLGKVGPVGQYFQNADIKNLAMQDPIHGTAAHRAILAGDHATAASHLMDMAHKMDERTADGAIKYLSDVNDMYYEHPPGVHAEMEVTHMSNTEQVRGGVEKFLGDRLGRDGAAANFGYQVDQHFATPLRHLMQGIRYTNDLGNNLEKGFRDAVEPIKQAWSRREHFAQEYMDKSGANKLIDDIATLKHAIKDRGLWRDFETLLVRESYTRAFADEELGIGRNEHINTGALRDVQSVADHKANRELMQTIRDRDPSGRLITMRNKIHEFEAADLENRKRAQASDMLMRMKIVDPTDRVGMLALIRDVRNEAVKMTPEEKTAFDRIVGKDHNAKPFKDYIENRKIIRSMLDQTDKNGPHVPFMRHGNHVVTAKYHVLPNPGVDYKPMSAKPGDLNQGFDFKNRADAEGFIKNVLSHKDIQITQTNGREVVYDTRTNQQAKIWTIEKSDGTARTFENQHEAEKAMEKGDELRSKDITPEDVKQRAEDNQPTSHFEVYSRVEFNPREYVRFDSERAANEYRNQLANMPKDHPNFWLDAANVETPRDIAQRGVAAHASSEMTQWVNRVEASPAYQKMTAHEQADWKRELNAEAARVTMMTGRRSINLPREYVKGASTDILKNMIQSTGSSARAIAGNMYNPRIALAREKAQAYTDIYKNQTGGEGRNHRARTDVLAELDRRLHAPIRVDGSWAQGIKRALQVSMISHLADASFLVINAMEPWILGAAITASRHGWIGSYSELAKANALVNPLVMAREAGREIAAAAKGQYRPANYEGLLLDAVKNERDAKGLNGLLHHMFNRGLTARDTGMEVERIHDPSGNILARGADYVDNLFRGGNTGIETLNRSTMAISNYRLEFRRAVKEGKTEAQAHEQSIRYAEDQIFKAAGDYGQWNNPRYFNNPFMKLGTQFKKYPLRIASVYADALIQAARSIRRGQFTDEPVKQVAYMLATQGLAAGALGLPIGAAAGTVNAAYILGLTDNKWSDVEFGLRKTMVDHGVSPEITDLVLRGALRWSGADFHPRLTQNSMVFFGDPDSRDPTKLAGVFGRTLLGAPGDWGAKGIKGFQQLVEAAGDYHAGAHDQAYQKGIQGLDGIVQIKALHNLAKAFQLMTQGPPGMPKGNEATTGQAVMQAVGFGPTQIARKQEEKRTIQAAKKQESEHHTIWVNRWLNAPNSAEQSAVWAQIQKNYNPTVPPEQRIQYSTLHKAQVRKGKTEKRDDSKLGVPLSGRQKGFADIGRYFATQ